jgi:molybdate transport system ATP-binding protein
MFQDPSLWPGMSALDNVAYGLRARKVGRREARKQAMTVLESLDATQIAPARAETLSGGEAQRVALARALAVAPDVLLLDEPTSSLDAAGRVVTRRVIEKALAAFEGAAVIVTHDPVEAMALADEIVVVERGRVTQSGTPGDMRARPRSDYVAQLVGVNLLRGRASGDRLELDDGTRVVAPAGVSGNVFVAIHPSAVALYRERPQGTPRNVWPLDVVHLDDEGERVRVQLAGSPALIAEVTPTAVSELRLHEGGSVWAVVKATQVEIYPR